MQSLGIRDLQFVNTSSRELSFGVTKGKLHLNPRISRPFQKISRFLYPFKEKLDLSITLHKKLYMIVYLACDLILVRFLPCVTCVKVEVGWRI